MSESCSCSSDKFGLTSFKFSTLFNKDNKDVPPRIINCSSGLIRIFSKFITKFNKREIPNNSYGNSIRLRVSSVKSKLVVENPTF
ncbi:hypothetical protein GW796_08500 [archaeon]|nr:hypothetical protein [archaeon]